MIDLAEVFEETGPYSRAEDFSKWIRSMDLLNCSLIITILMRLKIARLKSACRK